MKKVIVLGIFIILLVSMLAGCSESDDNKDDDKDNDHDNGDGDGNGDGDNDNDDGNGNGDNHTNGDDDDDGNDTITNGDTIKGSGTIKTITKEISDFTKIELGMAFVANIIQSSDTKVELKIDDNLEQYLVAKKEGETLIVSLQAGNTYQDVSIKAEISLPDLKGLELEEGAQATAYDFTIDHAFALDAEDSSQVSMTGSCDSLTLNADNDCSVFMRYFLCGDIVVSAHGSSRVTVNLTGALSGEVTSSTRFVYYGEPTSVDVTNNGGSVTHVEL
jgi:hypothetical protein